MGPKIVAASIVTAVSVVLGAGTGWSYWAAQGTGAGSVTTGILTAPSGVTAKVSSDDPRLVNVSWGAATVAGGAPEGGYHVDRVDSENDLDHQTFPCGTALNGVVTCTDQPPADGTYRYRVIAVHRSWTAASEWSDPVTVDTTPPGAPSAPDLAAEDDSGDYDTDDITQDPTPTFTGTAEAGATVTLQQGNVTLGVGDATGGGYSITVTELSGGSHVVTATATDQAGNTGEPSDGTSITVDLEQPAVTVEQAADQADPTRDGPIHFAVVFSEAVRDFTTEDVTTSVPDASILVTGVGASYDVAVSDLPDATVTVSVPAGVAHDAAGNGNTASTGDDDSVTRDTTSPDAPSKPDLADDSDSFSSSYGALDESTNTDDYTNDATPLLTGTAEPGTVVKLYEGGTVLAQATADPDGAYAAEIAEESALIDGGHDVFAVATDPAGNTSDPSAALTLTIDTVAPALTFDSATRVMTEPDEEHTAYAARFGGSVGTAGGDGDVVVLLCSTTPACGAPVPGPDAVFDLGTWWRTSDPVYICTVSAEPFCEGIDLVYVRASQTDRAGNTAVVVSEGVILSGG